MSLLERMEQQQQRDAACRRLVKMLRAAGLDPAVAATLEEQLETLRRNMDSLGDAFARLEHIIRHASRMRRDPPGGGGNAH